ncbi:hypothetical protein D9C73_016504 [Collichthys lucidus]|uniref:Uncharacterized protein n=1 Tax=Collichthys lucidus TaxID=240159 RepID=A0A4U5V767_COLLU|nr:hypothetical protein D9C73_016504 [Collichthys lucidus]
MQTGTRGRHWLLGTRPGTGTDREKMRQRERKSESLREFGDDETKQVNEGMKDDLTAEKVVRSRGVASSRPSVIKVTGAQRGQQMTAVLSTLHVVTPLTTVETVAFANEEQGDDGQNA